MATFARILVAKTFFHSPWRLKWSQLGALDEGLVVHGNSSCMWDTRISTKPLNYWYHRPILTCHWLTSNCQYCTCSPEWWLKIIHYSTFQYTNSSQSTIAFLSTSQETGSCIHFNMFNSSHFTISTLFLFLVFMVHLTLLYYYDWW